MIKNRDLLGVAFAVAGITMAHMPSIALAQQAQMQPTPAAQTAPQTPETVSQATQKLAKLDSSEVEAFLANSESLLALPGDSDALVTRVRALAILSPAAYSQLIALVVDGKTSDAQSSAIGSGLGRAAMVLSTSPLKEVRDLGQSIQEAAAQVKNLAFQRGFAAASGDEPTGALGAAGAAGAAGAGNIAAGNSVNGVNGGDGTDGGDGAFTQGTTTFDGASSGLTSGSGGGSSTTVISINSISSL